MWCHWCRKANHDDAQCFSTRPVDWCPKPADAEPQPPARFVVRELHRALLDNHALAAHPLVWVR
jgi:hypothetical protein